jgi:hypothetical protein
MRRLTKLPIPEILRESCDAWLAEFLEEPKNATKRFRYRDPAIKTTLKEETGWKCIYCESSIGHNTPGDIEHKVPSSKEPSMHFEWANLTVACTECNRRKNDYYETDTGFLDPYIDDVERCLVHLGPLVYWLPGLPRAECSVRILNLDNNNRPKLLDRKRDTLEKARALFELVQGAPESTLKALRTDEMARMIKIDAEYSAMVSTYFEQVHAKIG